MSTALLITEFVFPGCRAAWTCSNTSEACSFHCISDGCSLYCRKNQVKIPPPILCLLYFILITKHFYVRNQHLLYSSRVASRAIALDDSLSDEPYRDIASGTSQAQSPIIIELPSSSSSGTSVSVLSRLRQKFNGIRMQAIQRWPTVYLSSTNLGHASLNVLFQFSGAISRI